MKKLLVIIVFLIACNNINYAQPTLRSVFFVDENTRYRLGDNGTILKTTNGGIEWNKQVSEVSIGANQRIFSRCHRIYSW